MNQPTNHDKSASVRWPARGLVGLTLFAVALVALAETATKPASVNQAYPPVKADGSLDWDATNSYADNQGDEPMRVFHVEPKTTSTDGVITCEKTCDVHIEVLDANGNPDPNSKPNSNEFRMKQKKPGKKGKAPPDRWDATASGSGVTWANDCSDPMPPEGFEFVLWGGAGNKKDKNIKDVKVTLTNDGHAPATNGSNVIGTFTHGPNGRKFRIDTTLAYVEPPSGGGGLAAHPGGQGWLCALNTTGTLVLTSAAQDANAPYMVRSSLTRDDDQDDASEFGVDADSNPVPSAWNLVWSALAGNLNGQSQASFSFTVPQNPTLVLQRFWVAGVSQPNAAPNVGQISVQVPVTIVFSMTDWDGDATDNEEDETPLGE